MLYCNNLRAHWWATRLAAAEDLKSRAYYVASLTAVGDAACGAIHRLAKDPRPEVRSLAIPAMIRLSEKSRLIELSGLLADADADVRESAATALAFMGADAATRLLIEHAESPQGSSAAACVAALGRLSSPDALAAVCKAAASHADPFVRAQAVESLAACATIASLGDQDGAPPFRSSSDPILVLVSALGDRAIFTGHLALERQIATVSTAMSSKAAPSREKIAKFRLESTPPPAPAAPRTVAEIAASWLSSLTGRQIAPADLGDSGPAELADQCRRWIAERRQTSRPADAPAGEPAPAGSADTTSDADRQN
jgi:HEAT repeat protein